MHEMKLPLSIIIGVGCMIILGAARSVGGVVLLAEGRNALPNIIASGNVIPVLAVFLMLIGALEIGAAVGIMMRKPSFLTFGVVVTVAFVIDGAINGYLLFGKPGEQGTIVNLIAAILIISCLLIGRKTYIQKSASV